MDLAGEVRGQTVNGALAIKLGGERWDGTGLDARTVNGKVLIEVPESYAARLETATKLGVLNVNFPLGAGKAVKKELTIILGEGGAAIRAVTVNGDILINRYF